MRLPSLGLSDTRTTLLYALGTLFNILPCYVFRMWEWEWLNVALLAETVTPFG